MTHTERGLVLLSTVVVAVALLGSACLDDKNIRTNLPPIANAGKDQDLEYDGEPVEVRLDGRKSSDDDGEVVEYQWRHITDGPDGGLAWSEGDLDPENVARPELELERGTYTFMLWVTDDQGGISQPDSVTVKVGSDAVAECVADSVQQVPMECLACACAAGDGCSDAIANCREDCWMLILCIAQNCPDSSDTGCILTNCIDALGGADPAMLAGPCLTACSDSCSAE